MTATFAALLAIGLSVGLWGLGTYFLNRSNNGWVAISLIVGLWVVAFAAIWWIPRLPVW